MQWNIVVLGAISIGIASAPPDKPAPRVPTEGGVVVERPAWFEPGCQYVREIEYREVEHAICKVVPIKRTKWVYCSKPDYFCLPACPLLNHCREKDCDPGCTCQTCKGPYCRQALLKKKVEYECGTRCEVEVVKEKVPCTVWRKVPCLPTQPVVPSSKPTVTAPASSAPPLR
jgi:hypothetical protein